MNEAQIKRELLLAFEYSYRHDDWVEPLDALLAGLSPAQALWSSRPDVPSIWAIVLHLAVWHENIVERILTGEDARPAEGPWPPLPAAKDEVSWNTARKRLEDALDSVRTTIEATPLDTIQASPYGLGDLLCRFTHNGYHLGQIVKIREAMP